MQPAGEVALHVEIAGRGPCLLLAHGFAGSARNFRRQLRSLAGSWRCVAYDARGHARSGAPDDPAAYTPALLRHDLGRVLDRAGEERAVLLGLSLGAAAALDFARHQPARVRGLVLASYPAPGGAARARAFAEAIEGEGLEAAGARFVWGAGSGLDARGSAFVRQGFLEHRPHALAHLLRGVLAELPALERLVPELTGLAIPTLLLAGGADPGSLGAAQALAAALPRARLEVLEGAGHVLNLERPREFDALLERFLAELPP